MKKQVNLLRLYGFVLFMTVGAYFPYIFLYMRELGFSNSQIGILAALGPAVMMMMQPFWGWVSDRTGHPEKVSVFLALGMTLAVALLLTGKSFIIVLIYIALFNAFQGSVVPTYDSIVIGTLEKVKGVSYGEVRWLGSLGFAITAFVMGRIIEATEITITFKVFIGIGLLMAFLASRLPKKAAAITIQEKVTLWPLLKNREFVIFLVAGALVLGSNAVNNTFYPFLMTDIGGTEGLVGLAMFVGAFAEMPFFFFAHRLQKRFRASHLLLFAFSVTAFRWFISSLAATPYQLLVLQLLHGITFGLMYSTAVLYVARLTPERLRASGQNVFWAATFGFGQVVANLVAGWVYEYHPVQTVYVLGGIAATIGTLIMLVDMRLTRKSSAK